MSQPITAADGGWQGSLTGPADGDRITAGSVTTPLGQLLANQNALRVAAVSTWMGLQYAHNGQATTVPQRLVYAGRDASAHLKTPGWVIVALVGVGSIALMRAVSQNLNTRFAQVVVALGGKVEGNKDAAVVTANMYRKRDLRDFVNGSIGKQENDSKQ